jgi:hypothetical protein
MLVVVGGVTLDGRVGAEDEDAVGHRVDQHVQGVIAEGLLGPGGHPQGRDAEVEQRGQGVGPEHVGRVAEQLPEHRLGL